MIFRYANVSTKNKKSLTVEFSRLSKINKNNKNVFGQKRQIYILFSRPRKY